MTISEEAVKAAQNAIRTTNWEYGITDADMAKALTAALPFLSGQAAGVSADARQALDRFSFAAQQWGWQADQGSNDAIINDAKAEFDASYAALERILSALEPSATRELALEEIRSFNPREEVEAYEFRGDNGDYTPSEAEKVMLEDFAAGLLGRIEDAVFSRTPGGITNDD